MIWCRVGCNAGLSSKCLKEFRGGGDGEGVTAFVFGVAGVSFDPDEADAVFAVYLQETDP